MQEYELVKGDNLSKIGKRYGVSWKEIYEANKNIIADPDLFNLIEQASPGQLDYREALLRAIAVKRDTTRLIVAGGETSGAVVQALGARALAIGPEIDPGAPWTRVVDGPAIALALKSGNFGKDDFFTRAWTLIA